MGKIELQAEKNTQRKKCTVCEIDPRSKPTGGLYKDNPEDLRIVNEHAEKATGVNEKVTPVWYECCGAFKKYRIKLVDKGRSW